MNKDVLEFWSSSPEELFTKLNSGNNGISEDEAKKRLEEYGSNSLGKKDELNSFMLFISQFKSPIIIILILAAVISVFVGDAANAGIIFVIILISGALSFWQERGANNAVSKLLEIVQIKCEVLRDGRSYEIPSKEVVPGDIVVLNAGDIIPGDCYFIEGKEIGRAHV